MYSFSCVAGESLRIGDVARLHIRRIVKNSDREAVWVAIEWSGKERASLEVMTSRGTASS